MQWLELECLLGEWMKKGFIGPIGDDMPSLIPILFSLVIFFTTFTATFNVFEQGNTRFDRTIKMLKISNELRGDKYINDVKEFRSLCEGVTVRGVNFKAGLMDLKESGQPFAEINLVEFVNNEKGIYEVNGKKLACPKQTSKMREGSEAIVKKFPVAFQDSSSSIESGFAVRPMLLVVVVWF